VVFSPKNVYVSEGGYQFGALVSFIHQFL